MSHFYSCVTEDKTEHFCTVYEIFKALNFQEDKYQNYWYFWSDVQFSTECF
jgi:hypothetical protein